MCHIDQRWPITRRTTRLLAANSQLADRREAAMVEEWLAGFEVDGGTSAAYLSPCGRGKAVEIVSGVS